MCKVLHPDWCPGKSWGLRLFILFKYEVHLCSASGLLCWLALPYTYKLMLCPNHPKIAGLRARSMLAAPPLSCSLFVLVCVRTEAHGHVQAVLVVLITANLPLCSAMPFERQVHAGSKREVRVQVMP